MERSDEVIRRMIKDFSRGFGGKRKSLLTFRGDKFVRETEGR